MSKLRISQPIFFCLCLLLSLFLGSGSLKAKNPEALFQELNTQYLQTLQRGSETVTLAEWQALSLRFAQLVQSFSRHPKVAHALLRVGQIERILFQLSGQTIHLDKSLKALHQLIQDYPQSTLADDAQFLIGRLWEEDRRDSARALKEYQRVSQWPRGDMLAAAKQRIKLLQTRPGTSDATVASLPLAVAESPSSLATTTRSLNGGTTNLQDVSKPLEFERTRLPEPPFQGQGGVPIDLSRQQPKASLVSASYWATSKWAKFAFVINRPIPYLYGELPAIPSKTADPGKRVFFDFLDVATAVPLVAALNEPQSLVKEASLQPLNARIQRLSLTLKGEGKFQIKQETQAFQSIIRLDFEPASLDTEEPLVLATSPASIAKTTHKIQRIILDPGHGGHDPGASAFGVQEKDLVLQLAKEVRAVLLAQTSLEVFLTRETDAFVPLEVRAALARQHQGQLFISLHLNAHDDPTVQGLESYFLDVTDDEAAIRLARRENAMDAQGLSNFTTILRDLQNLSYSSASIQLTRLLHTHLLRQIYQQYGQPPRDLGVKEAPFVLLLGTGMPAVLLEVAFITNPEENRRLQEAVYRRTIATGIVQGIQAYLIQRQQG